MSSMSTSQQRCSLAGLGLSVSCFMACTYSSRLRDSSSQVGEFLWQLMTDAGKSIHYCKALRQH
eukprot:14925-Heterococcus_DN1.PRE.4